MSDPIADMLTRIRNAGKAKLPEVSMPSSKMKLAIAETLKNAGYVAEVRVEGETKKTLTITLKYSGRQREPVIEGVRRMSRPACRIYSGSGKIPRIQGGLGITVLSTSEGIMTGNEARQKNIGGEILCSVW